MFSLFSLIIYLTKLPLKAKRIKIFPWKTSLKYELFVWISTELTDVMFDIAKYIIILNKV